MKGLAIDFSPGGPGILLDAYVEGFNTTAQNAMVNLGTDLGSDPMWPERGTNIMRAALQGAVINFTSARHVANFAALSSKTFLISTEDARVTELLEDLTLSPVELSYMSLKVNAQITSSLGKVIGMVSNLGVAT